MTPLGAEIQRILEAESAFPPLSVDSIVKVLFAIGYGEGRIEESVAAGSKGRIVLRCGIPRLTIRAPGLCRKASRPGLPPQ